MLFSILVRKLCLILYILWFKDIMEAWNVKQQCIKGEDILYFHIHHNWNGRKTRCSSSGIWSDLFPPHWIAEEVFGNDCYLLLPKGYGESLLFQLAPCVNRLRYITSHHHSHPYIHLHHYLNIQARWLNQIRKEAVGLVSLSEAICHVLGYNALVFAQTLFSAVCDYWSAKLDSEAGKCDVVMWINGCDPITNHCYCQVQFLTI